MRSSENPSVMRRQSFLGNKKMNSSTSGHRQINSFLKKSEIEFQPTRTVYRYIDPDGVDLTPLPIVIDERKTIDAERDLSADIQLQQLMVVPHHLLTNHAISRSRMSSDVFFDSFSEYSEANTTKTKGFSEMKIIEPVTYEFLSEAALNALVNVLICESETYWIFDQQPKFMQNDSDLAPIVTKKNEAYKAIVATKLGNDRYMERGMNTFHYANIIKIQQTDSINHNEQGVMATIWSMWDAQKAINEDETRREDDGPLYNLSGLVSNPKSNQPMAPKEKKLNSAVFSHGYSSDQSPLQLAENTQDVSENTSVIERSSITASRDTGMEKYSKSSPKEIPASVIPKVPITYDIEVPEVYRMLHMIERALNLNTYHDKLLVYRANQLAQSIGPAQIDRSDTDLSSQFVYQKTVCTNAESIQTEEPVMGLHGSMGSHPAPPSTAMPARGVEITHKTSSVGHVSGGGINFQTEEPTTSVSAAVLEKPKTTTVENDAFDLPSLNLLWKYTCPLTKGRNITDMAFNVRNKDLLAVGYGQFEFETQRSGYVCCWNIKKITYPERIYQTSNSVTAVAWSARNENLLAVGMFTGVMLILDARKQENAILLNTTHSLGRHFGPIRRLQWVVREAGRSVGLSESLISLSTDGRVTEWSVRKGFDCTGDCTYNADLMLLKRPSLRMPSQQIGQKRTETLIARNAFGSAMAFNSNDMNIYLVGTDDGHIHKCSCTYAEQYLANYFSHTGSVYSIKWSPFADEVFMSCAADWMIKIWHLERPQPVLTISNSTTAVNSIDWSPTNSTMFACTNESNVEIWNLEQSTIDPVVSETVCVDSSMTCVLFAENSPSILIADSQGNIYVYALKNFPVPDASQQLQNQVERLDNVLASCLTSQLQG